jgi:hypothetical protein
MYRPTPRSTPTGPFPIRLSPIRLLTVLLVVASLAGCGRAGPPQPPDDEPRTYPREYPTR